MMMKKQLAKKKFHQLIFRVKPPYNIESKKPPRWAILTENLTTWLCNYYFIIIVVSRY